MKIRTEAESEKSSPLPGLPLSCEDPPNSVPFKPWEQQERKGSLNSMFNWRVKLQPPGTKPQLENKNKPSSKNHPKSTRMISGCKEMIDQTVIKILTKSRGKRSTPKQGRDGKNDGWRGPRDNPSEIAPQKKILKKESEVFKDFFKS